MAAQSMVLPLDSAAAEESARIMGSLLRQGRPVNALDVLIAGTASANGATVLISSDRDFLEIEKVSDLQDSTACLLAEEGDYPALLCAVGPVDSGPSHQHRGRY